MDTIAEMLAARADDDQDGLLFEDEAYAWRDIVGASAVRGQAALDLRRPGPFHIGVLLENVPEFVFWLGAAALAGAAVVGVNPTRRGAQLGHDITHTDCQLLVTDRQHLPLLEGLDLGAAEGRLLLVDDPAYQLLLEPFLGAGMPAVSPAPSETFVLLFTSGSTGAPKAVVCTQGRLARIGERTTSMYRLTASTTTYNAMPLFHGNALMANWAGVLAAGATFAMRRKFSASGWLDDVRRFDASYFNYVGRALAYVLATPELPDDADNPLELAFGTEASARDRDRFAARFGCEVVEGYGSSEGAIAIGRPPQAPSLALGKALNGADVVVASPESGRECPTARFDDHGRLLNGAEAIGELVGRNVADRFEGYYKNPQAESDRRRDGWYWSGDLGYRDADGWLYFAGRTSDRLRVDGENFSAAPIEEILSRFPGVVMVAVYPVPDPRTGDQVMAAVEMAADELFDPASFGPWLADQKDLGTKWAPKFVRVIEAMPLTATNKVQKQPLRTAAWHTTDAVYWRPGRELIYRALSPDDDSLLVSAAAEHGHPLGLAVYPESDLS
ncbi:MAG TPA: AMP-binding protein [Acidimicrobiales bacterium]|nr:AMP-binding protein [Acidimicrobiales bacterium]